MGVCVEAKGKRGGGSTVERSVAGSLYAAVSASDSSTRSRQRRESFGGACAISSPACCCLPAGTFPWSSGGFHIALLAPTPSTRTTTTISNQYQVCNSSSPTCDEIYTSQPHLHQLLIRLYSRTILLGANFHNSVLFCYSTNIILC